MTGLDVLLAVAGLAATALVVAGMILLTPRGTGPAIGPGGRAAPQGRCLRHIAAPRRA